MRPLLYDVFCGAGGAARGYQQAGFRVIGIDNRPQPRYCGDGFIEMDALEFLDRCLAGEFEPPAMYHASPPCQRYSVAGRVHGSNERHPDLIPEVRRRLRTADTPYVIENVVGARDHLLSPVMLCGVSFGLKVFRHRLFECDWWLPTLPHTKHNGAANSHRRPPGYRNAGTGLSYPMGEYITIAGHNFEMVTASAAMGVDWMRTRRELSEAIPPAYSRFIGDQAFRVLGRERVA